ncbi:MAG: PA0069 family radical SAM protein [Sneathiella sp.]|nr:PA0069 family radical SAM protein [Sneathiella sp.]
MVDIPQASPDDPRIRGRGATLNPASRFCNEDREIVSDNWSDFRIEDAPYQTTVTIENAKSILSRNTSPDLPFDRSINPYRGCEHGCIYCYARPTHAYMDLSAGLDFETKLFAKPNAASLLRKTLSHKNYTCKPIALGTNTDPYQPIEKKFKITRSILEVLAETKHPFTITTKSDLVLRDIDIISAAAKENLACVCISVTSLDNKLSRLMEPRASAPHKRLKAIETLASAGIKVIVQIAPVIPAINDMEIEQIMEAAKESGASQAIYIPVRLPHEVSDLFKGWLEKHYPDRARKVMKLIRSMRGGRDNDPDFNKRMRGSGPYADLIRMRFQKSARRLNLEKRMYDLDSRLFQAPVNPGDQLNLF